MIRRLLNEGKARPGVEIRVEETALRPCLKIRTEPPGGTINHAEKSAAFRGFINQLLGTRYSIRTHKYTRTRSDYIYIYIYRCFE